MFQFKHLDMRTRQLMLKEAEADGLTASEFYGRRLTPEGVAEWATLLRNAITEGNPETLAKELRTGGRLKVREERKAKKGPVYADVPSNAADILAQGEFNRYYIRALCLRVIDDGGTQVVVCRGRYSENPRPESQAIIGHRIDAEALLEDIRSHPGEETVLGIPLVNSGITVELPS